MRRAWASGPWEYGRGDLTPTLPLDVEPVLTDFGVARMPGAAVRTLSGTILGTLACIGPAALRILQLMSRGHIGLMTTHADSLEDALNRLEAMCLMANLGLSLVEIRRLIASTLRLITYQEMMPSVQARRVTHIVELCGVENDRYVLRPLFRYNPEQDRLEPTGTRPTWETR